MTMTDSPPVRATWKVPVVVSVVVALHTKVISVRAQAAATQPLTGGPQAIFANQGVETQEQHRAEVLAVCATRAQAEKVVGDHKQANPNLDCEYQITDTTIGPPRVEEAANQTVEAFCVGGCGTVLTNGHVWCDPCRQKQHQAGWRPEGKEEA